MRVSVASQPFCLLWHSPSVHCVNICCYDWFNKQTDWPVDEQDKVRQEGQTENDGMRKGEVRGVAKHRMSGTHKMR